MTSARVTFLGNSRRQYDSLPAAVRDALDLALDRLEVDPESLPADFGKGVDTKPITGAELVFRIAIRIPPTDPGYRVLYAAEASKVLVLRITRRDSSTYRTLRRTLRLIRECRDPGGPR